MKFNRYLKNKHSNSMKSTLKKYLTYSGYFMIVLLGIFLVKIGFEYFEINRNSFNITLLRNDIDGDGLSDRFEEKLFDLEVSPANYNKYISDLPIVEITMASKPFLIVDEEVIETSSETSEKGESSTTRKESSTTQTVNVQASATARISSTTSGTAKFSPTDFGGEVSTSVTAEFEATLESGWERTSEQRNTSEQSVTVNNSNSKGIQYSLKQGKFVCPVYVRNYGNLPASIRNITLTASITDHTNTPVYSGTLRFDGAEFPNLSLDGHSEKVLLNFVDDNLYSQEIDLLKDIKGEIDIQIVSIELSSPLINDYTKQRSLVKNKSARIVFLNQRMEQDKIIDVAVDDRASLEDITDLIGLNVTLKDNWIYAINGDRADMNYDLSSWALKHIGLREGIAYSAYYSLQMPAALDQIKIRRGDQLYFFKENVAKSFENLNNTMVEQMYYYNFAKEKAGIVDAIHDQEGKNVYTLRSARSFEKNEEIYNYTNYDITEEDIIKLYRQTLNQAIFDFYQKNLAYGAQDPKDCYRSAVRQAESKYPQQAWCTKYIKDNNLTYVDRNHPIEGTARYRTEFYNHLIENEIMYLHRKVQKVKMVLKADKSASYTFKFHDLSLKTIRSISINNQEVDLNLINDNKLEIVNPETVEIYCEYPAPDQASTLIRHVERFEFE